MSILIPLAVFWVCCGLLAHGTAYAYLQREFPSIAKEMEEEDFRTGVAMGLCGPLALIVLWLTDAFKHGQKWRRC